MLAVDQSYNASLKSSLNNAKTVVGLEWLYEDVRSNLSKLLVVVLVVSLGLPLVLFFGYRLKLKRKKFQRQMKKDLPLFKTHKDYSTFKKQLGELDALMPSLKKVHNYNARRAPWPIRYTLGQMQKMTSTLVTYNSWLKKRLDVLNEERFKGESNLFKFVSEKELWKDRNQAYQYWM
ncbi:hypothetical protein LZZ85_00820 [Terrimonas sp. NA20]|uniref:DUF4129 domain-containing protein n=1 Tax=Terrimonas ginsenosidimutans TaxID=2908004 RepID=A0ABS9KKD5_9BACT|nr:hypothetical protein [Terrimonas ginsenosidimutans]MCG2612793.1 hypothetical protein [Terrimonas ginsenosidimutans]